MQHAPRRGKGERISLCGKIEDRAKRRHRLTDHRSRRRARHAPAKDHNKEPVQDDIGDKTGGHGEHRTKRTTHIPYQRDKPRSKDLEQSARGDKYQIFHAERERRPLRAESLEQRPGQDKKDEGEQRAAEQQQKERGAEIVPLPLGVPLSAADGEADRAAHADSRARGLQKRGDGESEVDRR